MSDPVDHEHATSRRPSERGPAGTPATVAEVLLAAKVRVPRVRAHAIARPALVRALAAGDSSVLTLVHAPSGYGKTTLLTEWAAESARSGARTFAWLSLSPEDNDPSLLLRYLVHALNTAAIDAGERAELLSRVPGSDPVAWTHALLNDLGELRSPTTVVLDDYHLIDEPACHEIVRTLVEHAPPALNVVVSTRTDPPLGLGALRAAGRLTELHVEDLSFGEEEATVLLNELEDLALDPDDVASLTERTEGWPAGLYLAALSIRTAPGSVEFAGDDRHVVDYFREIVLDGLHEDVRELLLCTSIVDRFSADLGAALVGAPIDDALSGLERTNAFLIPLDQTRTWYRYHHLFEGMLRSEMRRRAPSRLAELHRRASRWHLEHGLISEGIVHATRGGDLETATALIAEHWLTVARSGQIATVERWVDAFDPADLPSYPELAVVRAFTIGMTGGPETEFRPWLDLAERGIGARGGERQVSSATSLEVGVNLLRAIFGYRDIPKAAADAARTVELERENGGAFFGSALANHGLLLYLSGDAPGARRVLDDLLRDDDAARWPFGLVAALATSAMIALDDDDAAEGDRIAREALERAESMGLGTNQVTGLAHAAIARALAGIGRYDDAGKHAEAALTLLRGSVLRAWHVCGLLCAAPIVHRLGDSERSYALLEEAERLIASFVDAGMLKDRAADVRRRLVLSRRRRHTASSELSVAEHAVLRELRGPRSRREIAEELSISLNTVKTHIAAIHRKLDVGSRGEAVARGIERGFI